VAAGSVGVGGGAVLSGTLVGGTDVANAGPHAVKMSNNPSLVSLPVIFKLIENSILGGRRQMTNKHISGDCPLLAVIIPTGGILCNLTN
jgi:hypothetical protein